MPSSLLQSLLKVQAAYVLSDPRQPDCPIVHASPNFLALTGYSREEVEGRNCRFLQVGGSPSQRVCVVHGLGGGGWRCKTLHVDLRGWA